MTRFLCASLLFLVALPLFAQEEFFMPLERPLPSGNQAALLNMKQQLTKDWQQIQQMLNVISPNDTQFIDTLKAQQVELTKQIKDVTQQLQAFETPSEVGMGMMPGMMPPSMPKPPDSAFMMGAAPDNMGAMPPGMPMPSQQPLPIPQRSYPEVQPIMPSQATPLYNPPPGGMMGMPDMPTGIDQNRAWDNSPWGPRPASSAKELTEIKQSVESLRKEIADLKATIKALETQIQLLNRNILLSEKIKEQ